MEKRTINPAQENVLKGTISSPSTCRIAYFHFKCESYYTLNLSYFDTLSWDLCSLRNHDLYSPWDYIFRIGNLTFKEIGHWGFCWKLDIASNVPVLITAPVNTEIVFFLILQNTEWNVVVYLQDTTINLFLKKWVKLMRYFVSLNCKASSMK